MKSISKQKSPNPICLNWFLLFKRTIFFLILRAFMGFVRHAINGGKAGREEGMKRADKAEREKKLTVREERGRGGGG